MSKNRKFGDNIQPTPQNVKVGTVLRIYVELILLNFFKVVKYAYICSKLKTRCQYRENNVWHFKQITRKYQTSIR